MKQSTDLAGLIKINIPWANGETAAYVREVPDASQIGVTAGAASWNDGFPPLTATAKASGGIPPSIQDMNGALKRLSGWTRYIMAAGVVPYDATWQAANGGYPLGAVVATAYTGASGTTGTLGRMWVSIVDGNTTNPDTGGAGWLYLPLPADVLALIAANAPQIVTSSPTVWVRTDGNDNVATTNPSQAGTANTAALAFRSPLAAISWGLNRYNLAGGFQLNVQAGNAGTYAFPGPIATAATVNLIGDTSGTGQANYVMSGAGPAAGGSGCVGTSQGNLNVSGWTLNNTTMVNHTVVSTAGRTNLTNCTWTQGTTSTTYSAMLAIGGVIGQGPGNIIQGGTYSRCRQSSNGGQIVIYGGLTLSGTPTFTINAQAVDLGGLFIVTGTDSGGANGTRYVASLNGVIDTNGGGANFFSGSTAGATGTGGQYA